MMFIQSFVKIHQLVHRLWENTYTHAHIEEHYDTISPAFLSKIREVKIKLYLCLTKHHTMKKRRISCLIKYYAMKTYWGVEVNLHAFLTLAQDGI
jgi:hypothetical protein